MNPLVLTNPCFSPLFTDPALAEVYGAQATIARFLAFEIALTRALGTCDLVSMTIAEDAIARMSTFEPDVAAIGQDTQRDGLPVPGFCRQLKAHVGGEAVSAVHVGATSQDLLDTAQSMALVQINDRLQAGLDTLIDALTDMAETHGAAVIMGRTRMQAALPIAASLRLATWLTPLKRHRDALTGLRTRVEALQLGGPVGDNREYGDKTPDIRAQMAKELGLTDPGHVWHTIRTDIVAYADWLSHVTGSLGKFGYDVSLMVQQGVDEIAIAGGGTSSAMPHKQNPVLAETLVTIARYNAVQVSGMHQAMVHEQERSGVAWALEWMILPAMTLATANAVRIAQDLCRAITRIGPRD